MEHLGAVMTDPKASRFADMLGALSQSVRLKIVQVAVKGGDDGVPAGEIARAVHCPPSTLSFHLKELTRCGLLGAAPQGRYIRYSVKPAVFAALAEFIGALPGATSAPDKAPGMAGKGRRPGRRARVAPRSAGTDEQLSIFGD